MTVEYGRLVGLQAFPIAHQGGSTFGHMSRAFSICNSSNKVTEAMISNDTT